MYILGISAYYHDSSAALLNNGQLIAAASEERFSRIKHDPSFPKDAIQFCLNIAGIGADQLSAIGYYERPFLKFERLIHTFLATAPRSLPQFLKAMPVWLKEKLYIKAEIAKRLEYKGKIFFFDHHLSHAASAFCCSPFQEAAFLTIDGVGEWTTTSIGIAEPKAIRILKEIRFPHSLGLLYSTITYLLGFQVNNSEYKVMGLAPYCYPPHRILTILRFLPKYFL